MSETLPIADKSITHSPEESRPKEYHPQEAFPVTAFIEDVRNVFFHLVPQELQGKLSLEAFELFCTRRVLDQVRERIEQNDSTGTKPPLLRKGSRTRRLLEGSRPITQYIPLEALTAFFGMLPKVVYNNAAEDLSPFGAERVGGQYRFPSMAPFFVSTVGFLHAAVTEWKEAHEVWAENFNAMQAEYAHFPLVFADHATPTFRKLWHDFLSENHSAEDSSVNFDKLLNGYVNFKLTVQNLPRHANPILKPRQWCASHLEWSIINEVSNESQVETQNYEEPPLATELVPMVNNESIFLDSKDKEWATLSAVARLLRMDYNRLKKIISEEGVLVRSVVVDQRNTVYSLDDIKNVAEIGNHLKYTIADPHAPEIELDGKQFVSHIYLLQRFNTTKQTINRLAKNAGAFDSALRASYFDSQGGRTYTVLYDLDLMRSNETYCSFEEAAANSVSPVDDSEWEGFFDIGGERVATLPDILRKLAQTQDRKILDAWKKHFYKQLDTAKEQLITIPILSKASGVLDGYSYDQVAEIMSGYSYAPKSAKL